MARPIADWPPAPARSRPRFPELVRLPMDKDHTSMQRVRAWQPLMAGCRHAGMVVIATVTMAVITTMTGGCGSRRPEMAAVVGTVSFDGQPLAHGVLTFESPGMRPATARVVDGRIVEATTFRTGDGVPVGTHMIAVFARDNTRAKPDSDPGKQTFAAEGMVGRSLLPRRYNVPATSGLSATITAGSNTLSLSLTRDPP